MTLCQHVNNVFCTLCNIFWFCHLWLIFMTLLFRKLVNKTDIFLVAFLFLEASAPSKKSECVLCWWYVSCSFRLQSLLWCQLCLPVWSKTAASFSEFSGHMEDWTFVLSCSEMMCKCPEEHLQLGSVLFKSACRHLWCFLLCSVSAPEPYRAGLGTESSSHAPWICSVHWFSSSLQVWGVVSEGCRKFPGCRAALFMFPSLLSEQGWTPPAQEGLRLWNLH